MPRTITSAIRFEDVAADVAVAVPDRLDDRRQRQLVLPQAVRVDVDLVLLHMAAHRGHLGHAGHRVE